MTASILARVASLTKGDWLITRETVFFETFASRAMSLMVARRPAMLSTAFDPVTSCAVVGVPDVFVLDMRVVLAAPSDVKGAAVYAPPQGVDKMRPASLNDTGFPRHNIAVRQLPAP